MKSNKKGYKSDEEIYEQMGRRLRQLRKEKGFKSYEDLALEAGIPIAQYGRYERGRNLKMSSLLKILRAMDVPVSEFFAEGFE